MDLTPRSTDAMLVLIVFVVISAIYIVGPVFLGKYLRAPLVLIGSLIGITSWGMFLVILLPVLNQVDGVSEQEALVFLGLLWITPVLSSWL